MPGLDERLLFVVGAPRSGTTLLTRLLHGHEALHARPETHLLTPLAHLGYHGRVERAPYDPVQTHRAARRWVADLPAGEQGYLAALRAYTDAVYTGLLEGTDARFLVDKTPAYSLILPFVRRLYPRAHVVVLTRHPFAIFSSFASTFFAGDWDAAHRHNPVVERYVPALGTFLRAHGSTERVHRVPYEALVADPGPVLRALCARIGVRYQPSMVDYGATPLALHGLGDPDIDQAGRPHAHAVHRWVREVAGRPERQQHLQRMVEGLDDRDLDAIGTPRAALWDALRSTDPPGRPPRRRARAQLQRRALIGLRRAVHGSPRLGRTLSQVRLACDVLLRE